MTDEEVHVAIIDEPEAKPTDGIVGKDALVVMPQRKEIVMIRLDADFLQWFRSDRSYQTRINAILRPYIKAHADD